MGTNNSLTCYKGIDESTEACPSEELVTGVGGQNLIDNAVWNLGGYNNGGKSAKKIYTAERSTTMGSGLSAIAKTEWVGKVGLMYASDYGYASKDWGCHNHIDTRVDGVYKCKLNNWLHKSDYRQWTLSPVSSDNARVFDSSTSGGPGSAYAYERLGVKPVLYLKSNIKVTSGDGSYTAPYQLSA